MTTHFSILAWEVTWTEEPGGPQSEGLQRVGCNLATEHTRVHMHVWPLAPDIVEKIPTLWLSQNTWFLDLFRVWTLRILPFNDWGSVALSGTNKDLSFSLASGPGWCRLEVMWRVAVSCSCETKSGSEWPCCASRQSVWPWLNLSHRKNWRSIEKKLHFFLFPFFFFYNSEAFSSYKFASNLLIFPLASSLSYNDDLQWRV